MHHSRLIGRREIAPATLALTLSKPDGFVFRAGQYTTLAFEGDEHLAARELSIASAPYESMIEVAVRVRSGSAFKTRCAEAPVGTSLLLSRASGELGDHPTHTEIWIAGGIGISPIRGIARQRASRAGPGSMIVIHVARSYEDLPYRDEFAASAQSGLLTYIPMTTRLPDARAMHGRLDQRIIEELVPDAYESKCTIVGTRMFVAAMKDVCAFLSPTSIVSERFCGYEKSYSTHESRPTHQLVPGTH